MTVSAPARTAFARPRALQPQPRAIANWLMFNALLVFTMVVVGGITRLTESGLSITQWNPVSGAIPPLSHADWQHQFDLYKSTTQFQTVNRNMTLADFQFIFFWEYIHRLIGRAIGMVFALPLLWFAWKRAIPHGFGWRLVALLALGGLQGVIGWWMVVSGLVGRTEVSHIRLAIHLINALVIIAGLVWTAMDIYQLARDRHARPARLPLIGLAALLALVGQLTLGAFTAGLRAGYAFSSWPKMGDEWFPSATPMLAPAWRNIVDNPIVVQFAHRWWAWVVAALMVLLASRLIRKGAKGHAHALLTFVALQISLGIATLLTGVTLWIAVAHQAVGALLTATTVIAAHRLGQRRA